MIYNRKNILQRIRRIMKRKIIATLLLPVFILLFAACSALRQNAESPVAPGSEPGHSKDQTATLQPGSGNGQEISVEDMATEVLTAIKNFDMEKLADAVHPDKGVRFSPYAFVDVERDLVFTADEVRNLAADTKTYLWGYYDGTGDPIELTFRDYHREFIYDADFLNAEQVSVNETLGRGNTVNNSFEVYKDAEIVEFYFSGIDPKYEGMDWKSLRLVFEKKDDTWYLVGIIHDQWTI